MRLLVGLFLLAGVAWGQKEQLYQKKPGDRGPESYPVEFKYIGNPEAIAAGEELYQVACSGCHGASGEGGRGPSLILGRGVRRKSHQELFDSIKDGIPGTDMPPFPLPDDQVWKLTAFVRNLSAPAVETKLPGDPERGKALFFGKAGCSNCHMVRGKGGFLGPDLSNAGLRNYAVQLREGLLEPNKRITEGFEPVRVVTKSGEKIEGVAKSHTNYSIRVLDAGGKLHVLSSRDVEDVEFLEDTWMPDDYAERFSQGELDDILAFLSRQASRMPLPPEQPRGRDEEEE